MMRKLLSRVVQNIRIHRLSYRVLLYILLFGFLLTLTGATLQLYDDYRKDITSIDEMILQIRDSCLQPLSASLWEFDINQLQIQLEGIGMLPNIQYVEVRERLAGNDVIIAAVGSPASDKKISRRFPLEFGKGPVKKQIGSFLVNAGLGGVYVRLGEKALLILATHAFQGFFISLFILLLFHYVIMRHLNTIAAHMHELGADHLESPLALNRKTGKSPVPDVLDRVVDAINNMKTNLRRDMNRRKQAEDALRESEALYRAMVEAFDGHVYICSKDYRIEFMNDKFKERIGSDATGDLCYRASHGRDTVCPWCVNDRVVKGETVRYEMQSPLDNKWYYVSSSPIYHTDGRISKQVMIFDVTERKQAEAALRKSEERYREFVEGTDNLVTQVDEQGKITFVNHSSETVFGLIPEDCIGLSAFDFIYPEDRERTMEAFSGWIKNRVSSATFENRQVSRTGDVRDMLWTINIHYKKEGDLQTANSIGRDITERKRTEKEVRGLRNLLKNIIDSMPSILIGVDNKGRITQWNQQAVSATDVSAENAQGALLAKVFPGMAKEMDKIRQAIASRQVQKESQAAHRVDGETRFSELTVYPLISNGVDGAVIRVDDITERVRIEEMMIQSEKMLSVGGLAAGMAHEINNPLAGIVQNIQVVLNRILKDMPENDRVAAECGADMEAIREFMKRRDMVEMLEAIRISGARAAEIVKNMLSFSRKCESGAAPADLGELLDETVDLAASDYDLKKKYDFKNIEIVREYDPDLPDAPCEKTKIQQVILNLLKNAAEAMAENVEDLANDVEPGAKAPRIILRASRDGEMARIEVEDNGPEMDEATRKRVFDPFFPAKGVGEGTGLGPSVSYFIITENHGGAMTVESPPGGGAKFVIRLPLEIKR